MEKRWRTRKAACASTAFLSIKHGEHIFYFFWKTVKHRDEKTKQKQLIYFDYQNVNSLCSRHHYVNSSC